MADVNFYDVIAKDGKTPAERFAEMSKEDESFYTVGADLYIGSQKLTNGADLATVVANVAQNTSDIVTINQTLTKLENDESTNGSIRNLIRSYLNTLNGGAGIASQSGKAITIASSVAEVAGVISATGTPITLADVASTGAAEDVSYSSSTSGLSATNVQAAIDEVAAQSAGGVGSKTIWVEDESAGQSDYAKVYKIYQCATQAEQSSTTLKGTINIPKDEVLKDANIVDITFDATTNKLYDGATDVTALIKGSATPTEADAGKYLKMEMQNVADPLYVNLQIFVDVYTIAAGAPEIQLAINDHEFSASVVSIDGSKIVYKAETSAGAGDGETVKQALARIDGADTVSGSISKKIKDAIEALDTASDVTIASKSGDVVTIKAGISETDGVISQGSGSDITLAAIASTGAAEDASYDNTTSGMTATDMQGAVDELKDAIDNIDVSGDIQAAIETLDGSATIATKSGNAVTLKAGVSEIDGIVSNSSNADITLADIAVTGSSADVSYVKGSILTVGGALDDLYTQVGGGGTIDQRIADAIDALDTASDVGVASVSGGVVTISGSIKEEDGIIAKGTATDITLSKAATTGAAEDIALTDAGSYFTTDNVEAALQDLALRLTWREI